MCTEEFEQLSVALHRKLLNVNAQIRQINFLPARDRSQAELSRLKTTSKRLDKAYSACKNNMALPAAQRTEDAYSACLTVYKET
jgi:hypothetical protein